MASVPYRMWAEYFKLLLIRAECPATKCLDVCCGTGTLCEMLTLDAYEMTGFDLSEPMIVEARRKATEKGLDIRYEVADATQFELNDTFGAAFSFFDSLNYITTLEGLRDAIRCVARHLEPDGVFIFDLNTAYAFEQQMFTQKDTRQKSTIRYDWVGEYDRESRVIEVQMKFWKGDEKWEETHRQRAHSAPEVREALADADFELLEFLESYTLDRPNKRSDRIHYVARLRA